MSSICCAAFPPPRPSSHPVDIGLRSEAAILAELVRRGYSVSVPFGTNQRYDLIIDFGDRLARVQCKTGRVRDGKIKFSARSTRVNAHGAYWRGYQGEIEYFAIYCAETDGVYLVPIEEATRSDGSLRLEPPRNNQARRIRWASDYELPPLGDAATSDLQSSGAPA